MLDEDGDVISAQVLDPGAFYSISKSPTIYLNGVDYTNDFNISVDSMLISIVLLTNFDKGSPGIGTIEVTSLILELIAKELFSCLSCAITDGEIDSTTMAHEIGHNLGLFHAERYLTRSEKQ